MKEVKLLLKRSLCTILSAIFICTAFSSCKDAEETSAPEPAPEVTQKPAQRYTALLHPLSETKVIPNARGKIIKCPYEEGDTVSKGSLLYEIEDSGIADNIATTKNAIKKANITIDTANEDAGDLVITAPASGILHNFSLKEGERVSSSTIGEIIDESVIIAKVPFTAEQKSQIRTGMSGVITSADYMSSIPASVTRVYDAQAASIGGSALYYAELTAANPGGFNSGDSVGAAVYTPAGELIAPESGTIEMKESVAVVSKGSGNAVSVNAKDGDYVSSGQELVRLENSTVNATLERAKLDKNDLEIKLRSLEEDYADLKIYAPASGVITEKNKSLDDSISSTSDFIMMITDTSAYTMDIDVSEEDKERIWEGMNVNVTIHNDADLICTGTVSMISQNERISGADRVYAAVITVDNSSGAIRPNATASVSFEQ